MGTESIEVNLKSQLEIESNSNNETSYANAIRLNNEVQQRLLAVRANLEAALKQVEQRYKTNETCIKSLLGTRPHSGVGVRGANLRGATFYFKGSTFFRDAERRSCPNNSDYMHRLNAEGEMFPMDLELRGRHIWSLMDKLSIVQAIKEQVVDFLNDQHSHRRKSTRIKQQIDVHSDKLVNFLERVKSTTFEIDWHQVSAHNLRYRHSSSSCQAMWQLYLHPSLRQCAWSKAENESLTVATKVFNQQNWPAIARQLQRRSDYQCFVQYYTRLHVLQPNRWARWDKADDQRLLDCITKHTLNGIINWNLVNAHFPHKSKAALQGRYAYSLHPTITHEPFTNEEDVLLLAAVKEYGTKFSLMPRTIFPNRSLTQLRSRYFNVLQNRHKAQPWTIEDDQRLLELVAQLGKSEWLACSAALGNHHSRTSCRTRFLTIQRYFDRNPNATLADLPRLKSKRMASASAVNTENWEEKIIEMQLAQLSDDAIDADGDNNIHKVEPNSQTKRKDKEKKSNPTNNVRRKTDKYGGMLPPMRSQQKKFYDLFKHAYNFQYPNEPKASKQFKETSSADIESCAHALGWMLPTKIDEERSSLLNQTYPTELRTAFDAFVSNQIKTLTTTSPTTTTTTTAAPTTTTTPTRTSFTQELLPSRSTGMCFRAVCIQLHHQSSSNGQHDNEEQESTPEFTEAAARFRERLRVLFRQTALQSRSAPDNLPTTTCSTVKPLLEDTKKQKTNLSKKRKNPNHQCSGTKPAKASKDTADSNVE